MAMMFRLRKIHAIHCCAVSNTKTGFVIAGNSGSGKSTLTDKLLKNDFKLMSDDVAMIKREEEKVWVYPSFPQIKLCRDAAIRNAYDLERLKYIDEEKDKYAIKFPGRFDMEPRQMKSLFILQKADVKHVTGKKIVGSDKLLNFVNYLFLRGMFRYLGFPAEQMQISLDLLSLIDMHIIIRPVDGDSTDEQMNLLLDLLHRSG